MNVIIDANVFKAFYEEEVLEQTSPRPGRTASPAEIFVGLGKQVFSYIDDGKQIEHEWRNACNGGEEWFEGWLASAYASGGVTPIDAKLARIVEAHYAKHGFPTRTRDIWYVRVAASVSSACSVNPAYLVSEDADFYDPTKKQNACRERYIREGRGVVAKQLKNDGVTICCIAGCLEHLRAIFA